QVLVEGIEHRLLADFNQLDEVLDAGRAGDAAYFHDVAQDPDSELGEEIVGEGAGGDAGGGFAGAAALGDVAGVVGAELHGAGEVGVAGPGPGDRVELLGVLDPVHDLEGQDGAEGVALADAGDDLGLILFQLHAGAAAVAALAPREFLVDDGGVQGSPV